MPDIALNNSNPATSPVTVTTSSNIPASQTDTRIDSATATTQTLPVSPPSGTKLFFKNVNTGPATIAGTIENQTNYALTTQNKYLRLTYNGTFWDIAGNNCLCTVHELHL